MQPVHRMMLHSGELTWRAFGDPEGRPLFFFHGWPGSSLQCAMLDRAAQLHGFRGIAIDRPGIAASSFVPGRRIIDWPPLLLEFAARLGIARFAVIGVSGGGPYALACAALCPSALTAAAVVCGAPPIAELPDRARLHPGYRALLRIHATHPERVRTALACARPVMRWPSASAFFHPAHLLLPTPDAEALADPAQFEIAFGCQQEAFASIDGLFADAALYAAPWGFRIEEIPVPVQFWHGCEDVNFHHTLAADLARRVKQSTLRILENEGHFSLPIRHAESIVAALAKAC